jgi:hypothetical protein
VPTEGAAGSAPGLTVLVFRTSSARWRAFLPAYRARVLGRPLASGVETQTEVIDLNGTEALLGEVPNQMLA